MSDEELVSPDAAPHVSPKADHLSPAARRALEEAAARRAPFENAEQPVEKGGRGGLEPVRYGDWEVRGLASDF